MTSFTEEYMASVDSAVRAASDSDRAATVAWLEVGRVFHARPDGTTVKDVVLVLHPDVRRLLPEKDAHAASRISQAVTVFREYCVQGGMQPDALARHSMQTLYANRPSKSHVDPEELAKRPTLPRAGIRPESDSANLPAARSAMAAASEPANVTVTLSPATAKVAERLASDDKLPGITALVERLITAEAARRAKVGEAKRKRAERKAATAQA